MVWAAAAEGKVPLGAVQGGVSEAGEDLYIGRCKIEGKKVYGKVCAARVVVFIRRKLFQLLCCYVHVVLCALCMLACA